MSEQLAILEPSIASEDDSEPLINEFRFYLTARGYAPRSLRLYVTAAAHFLRWLYAEPPERRWTIDTQAVRVFLREHLSGCRCPRAGSKDVKSVRAALNQLLLMCGERRLHRPDPSSSPGIDALVAQFDLHLHAVCGLTEATRWYHRRHIRCFLTAVFGSTRVDPGLITPDVLIGFVTEQARTYRPGSIGVLAYSLRSFLRFLQLQGDVPAELAGAVPKPPDWSLAPLPASLSDGELIRFWAVFDRGTAIGRRDYAMARCLADLGLRCHEVAALCLKDIDWRSGILHLSPGKNRRAHRLPLPQPTGAALVDYLRHGRPTTPSRALFVQHRAPVGEAVTNATVRGAIRRAFLRAVLPWTGTHILRHTAASRMVQGGASLKEVADVLRHQSIDTTAIYTKVDLPNLYCVALPWPGRCP